MGEQRTRTFDGPFRILHVDDDQELAETAAEFVRREDDRFDVEIAGGASEALDRLADEEFDCVVSDHELPGQNGIEFLEAVRAEYPDLPFIFFTGKGSEEVASDAISAGVTDYLQKETGPSQYTVLANRIRNAVKKYRTQAELSDREKRLNLFFEQSPLGVIEWDDQFELERMNDAATEILGYSEGELAGDGWDVIVPESDRDEVAAVVAELLENKGGYHSINENVRDDGERILCEWHNRVVTDADGDVVAVFSQFQDVTERREQKRRLEAITRNTHTFIALLDPDGTLLEVNDTALSIGGLDREEVVGTRLWNTGWAGPTDEVRATVRDAVDRARDGEPFRDEIQIESTSRDRIIDFSVRPITDEREDVTLLLAEGNEITERKRHEKQLEAMRERTEFALDATDSMIYDVDLQSQEEVHHGPYERLFGVDLGELDSSEEVLPAIIHPEDLARVREFERIETLEEEDWHLDYDFRSHPDRGDTRWLHSEAYTKFGSDGSPERLIGLATDITERRERENRIAALNEVAQTLTAAETPGEVAETVVDATAESLGFPLTTVDLYDSESGSLDRAAQTEAVRELLGDGPLLGPDQDLSWQVYAANDGRVIDDLSDVVDRGDANRPVASVMMLPIGTHGVFVSGATTPAAFDETELTVAQILVSNAQAALDRVDREQTLRSQKQRLQEKNTALERVERINRVIRSVIQSLPYARSRDEIGATVCQELAERGPYTFSVIAERRSVDSNEMVFRTAAGEGEGYLDAVSAPESRGTPMTDGPVGQAFRERTVQVQELRRAEPPFDPLEVAALERDFQSSIVIPLVYGEKMYGVLNIYTVEPGLFGEMEVTVLEELGRMVGYAINAMEQKKMLVSDVTVALEFALTDPDVPAVRFAQELGGQFTFEEILEQTDGGYRVFFTMTGVDPENVFEYSDIVGSVQDLSLVSEHENGVRFEGVISESGFLGQLLSYGAYPRELSASADEAHVTVELPRSGDIQSFIQMFIDTYTGAELLNRQEYNRPVQTREQLQAIYKDILTPRQEEVLKTAYFSGFFEWPREQTGQEIAERLGISQPTASRHIRKGEQKILGVVFDDDQADDDLDI